MDYFICTTHQQTRKPLPKNICLTAGSTNRNYFEELSKQTNISDKSLQRMFSPKGNPTTSNFCSVVHAIQQLEGISIDAKIHH